MHTLVSDILLVIAGMALIAIVIIVSFNIILRQFATSFGGTAELVGWLTSIVISLSLAASQSKKVHVSMSALIDSLPSRFSLYVQLIICLIIFLFFTVLAWELGKFGINIMNRNSLSPTLQIPYYGFIMITTAGFFFFSTSLFMDLFMIFHKLIKNY